MKVAVKLKTKPNKKYYFGFLKYKITYMIIISQADQRNHSILNHKTQSRCYVMSSYGIVIIVIVLAYIYIHALRIPPLLLHKPNYYCVQSYIPGCSLSQR